MSLEKIVAKLQNRIPTILDINEFLKFSVLVPLIEKENGIHVLFEVRAFDLRRQPGEICFPGGKIEKSDKDEKHSAIRETTEELGILEHQITHTFPLDYMVSPFGTIIYPYVGTITEPRKIRPNPSEVAEVFTVPLSFFMETKPDCYKLNFRVHPEEGFPYESIHGGENYNWQTRKIDEYFYHYEDKVIWGLTAKVLVHFVEILRDVNK
jgi:coenzyme A diphosphatase NUDT7